MNPELNTYPVQAFSHALNKFLSAICYVWGIVLGFGDRIVNKRVKIPALITSWHSGWRGNKRGAETEESTEVRSGTREKSGWGSCVWIELWRMRTKHPWSKRGVLVSVLQRNGLGASVHARIHIPGELSKETGLYEYRGWEIPRFAFGKSQESQ